MTTEKKDGFAKVVSGGLEIGGIEVGTLDAHPFTLKEDADAINAAFEAAVKERVEAVTEFAAKMLGRVCGRHEERIKGQSFTQFSAELPECVYCLKGSVREAEDRVWEEAAKFVEEPVKTLMLPSSPKYEGDERHIERRVCEALASALRARKSK